MEEEVLVYPLDSWPVQSFLNSYLVGVDMWREVPDTLLPCFQILIIS